MATITISFTLDDLRDADLMLWLQSHKGRRRSGVIRDALRAGIEASQLPEHELKRIVEEAVRSAMTGFVISASSEVSRAKPEEPPRAAAALDSLEERLEEW